MGQRRRDILRVPRRYDRNAARVRALGDPADTGARLISYMCARLGVADLGDHDVLDLGCGVRFTQAILNRGLPVRSYTGIEVERRLVRFLRRKVTDPRFTFHHMDVRNQRYNPGGQPLDPAGPSPLGAQQVDVACMFSVITHQRPDEAAPTFAFLRRHTRDGGHLFFSAFVHDDDEPYRELDPRRPGLRSSYSAGHLEALVGAAGWRVVSHAPPRPDGLPIQASLLCVTDP